MFGDGIYETHLCAPYFEEKLFYTQKQDTVFAFYAYEDVPVLPKKLTLHVDKKVSKVTCKRTGQTIKFRNGENSLTLFLEDIAMAGAFYAECFVLE